MIENDEIHEIMRIFASDKRPDFGRLFPSDITRPEYAILLTCKHIGSSGKTVYVSDVVNEFSITPQAISKQLRSCEQKGFIERSADKADRRNIIVTVTPEGERVLEKTHSQVKLLKAKMIEKIGLAEFAELVKRMRYYRELLCDTIEEISGESKEVTDAND